MAKRKRSNKGWVSFILIVLIFIAYRAYQGLWPFSGNFSFGKETTFVSYPGFGIDLPADYAIHGIDVSRYQKDINWRMVKAMQSRDVQLHFAIIKATEGKSLVDKKYKRNWSKSKEAGLVRGAYHFFRADVDAAAQARLFIQHVSLMPGDLPPVLDVESLYGEDVPTLQQGVALWLTLIEQHYNMKPIIYSNASFYNSYLHPRFADYPLWVAHYKEQNKPRVTRNWVMWQHNEGGRVDGINAFVDFNVFKGDSTDFAQLLKRKQ